MRQVHRAGEKTFIDFSGKRSDSVVDRRTGEVRSVSCLWPCFGASSYTTPKRLSTQQLPDWVGARTRMVEYIRGHDSLLCGYRTS